MINSLNLEFGWEMLLNLIRISNLLALKKKEIVLRCFSLEYLTKPNIALMSSSGWFLTRLSLKGQLTVAPSFQDFRYWSSLQHSTKETSYRSWILVGLCKTLIQSNQAETWSVSSEEADKKSMQVINSYRLIKAVKSCSGKRIFSSVINFFFF